jgi:hypothetical protein
METRRLKIKKPYIVLERAEVPQNLFRAIKSFVASNQDATGVKDGNKVVFEGGEWKLVLYNEYTKPENEGAVVASLLTTDGAPVVNIYDADQLWVAEVIRGEKEEETTFAAYVTYNKKWSLVNKESGEVVDAVVTITCCKEELKIEDIARKLCEYAEFPFC